MTMSDWPHIDKNTPSPKLPLRGNVITRNFSKLVLKAFGFKIIGNLPPMRKLVAIVGPHTSNWDFVIGMFIQYALGVKFSFMIKKSAFVPGFKPILLHLGGVPIDRTAAADITEQMVTRYEESDELVLVITPEGTRSNKKSVKSGFHRIAKSAGVPIMITRLDFAKRELQVGHMIDSDISWEELSALLDEYFEGVKGKNGYWMDRKPNA